MIATRSNDSTVVVIGAGPAGSAIAAACAGLGHQVELLERDRFPRAKVCGCCLADRGVATLRRMGLDSLADSGEPLRAVELCADGRRVPLAFHGSVVLSRETLDSELADHAVREGVHLRTRVRASVDPDGSVQVVDLDTGESVVRRPRVILVADGLGGRALDRHPAFTWKITGSSRFGAGLSLPPEEISDDAPRPGLLSMIAGRGGYLGLVRLPDGRLDLAAALDPDAARRDGGPGGLAARLLREDGREQLAATVSNHRWRGTARLTRRRRVATGNIACVGDSSGYVEPFTGEGMSWALESSERLVDLVNDHLLDGRSLEAWRGIHRRATQLERLRCRTIAIAARHPRTTHALVRAAARLPLVRTRLADSASGVSGSPTRDLTIGGRR